MHGLAEAVGDRIARSWKFALLGVSAAVACALPLVAAAPAGAAPGGKVYITLGFDDGSISQWNNRDVLQKYGVNATYFINSSAITNAPVTNTTGPYMSWAQLQTLQAEGNDIGGHTKTHVNLRTQQSSAQLQDPNGELCGDRKTLVNHGFPTLNFAYPYGEDGIGDPNPATRAATLQAIHQAVQNCGYQSARVTRAIDAPHDTDPCDEDPNTGPPWDCVWAETWPTPGDPFGLRAAESHLNNISGGDPDKWRWSDSGPSGGIRGAISRARNYRGGWFNIVLHDICVGDANDVDTCNPNPYDDYAIPKDRLDKLLNWICQDPQLQVVTTAQALGQVPIPPKTCQTGSVTPRIDPPKSPLVKKPKPRIYRISKKSKRRVRVTVAITDSSTVRRVRLLVDGKVVRSYKRTGASRVVFTIRPGTGKHKLTAQVIDSAGEKFGSTTRKVTVKRRR
ncbi:MAG TPA: polysaccharide deacetylase family protein [Baekduia sp.]|nr:polysaccharide deacetylase family protein [Baekduia sp.]